jgi:hypothetical protein
LLNGSRFGLVGGMGFAVEGGAGLVLLALVVGVNAGLVLSGLVVCLSHIFSLSLLALPYTISEFCALYYIGRTNFYALQKAGEGPVELRAGRRKVLTRVRSAQEWERQCEKHAANDANASDAA